ncbi:MAG: hypothetical protein M9962_05210 [Oligoflexia bacterium]|nr:hypothetical protein [Oligoflexia bacterium]
MLNLKKTAILGLAVVMAVTLSACGGKGGVNPSIDGVEGPNVELVNGRLVLSMVFKNVSIDGGATIPIPKYPNSSVQVGPDFQSAGTLLVLTVSVTDFLGDKGAAFDPQTLPGGRPLPSVASGVMPAIAIQVPQLFNTVFYVGPEVIGFFVPFKLLDLQGAILTFRFHNTANEPIGILALVGSDTKGKNAGILAMMRADLMGIIKKPSSSTLAKLSRMF